MTDFVRLGHIYNYATNYNNHGDFKHMVITCICRHCVMIAHEHTLQCSHDN